MGPRVETAAPPKPLYSCTLLTREYARLCEYQYVDTICVRYDPLSRYTSLYA